jgi:hypothetical protein
VPEHKKGIKEKTQTVLVGKAEGKSPFAVQYITGRIVLKLILRK